jgi:hypothetical protein
MARTPATAGKRLVSPKDRPVGLYPRRRRGQTINKRPWDWVYKMWSPKTQARIRRERQNRRQAWHDPWYSGIPRGFTAGTVVLFVGVIVLITVLVPTGLIGGAVCVRDIGCAWSNSQGVRIAPTDQPVTVTTH